jgi:hypothetical protein
VVQYDMDRGYASKGLAADPAGQFSAVACAFRRALWERNHMPQRCLQVGLNDLVDHAELVAELAVGTGLVEHAQGMFPEAASHRQVRLFLGEIRYVVLPVAD